MARFDLYHGKRGYLLDAQAELLDFLTTRIVIPLLPNSAGRISVPHLHPVFVVDGKELVLATHLILAIPKREIGAFHSSLTEHADTITRALDTALQGF